MLVKDTTIFTSMGRYLVLLVTVVLVLGCGRESDVDVDDTPVTELGEITFNGKPVDPDLFTAWAEVELKDYRTCPPTSDPYVRDHILKHLLIVEEGERQGFEMSEWSTEKVKEHQKILASSSLKGKKLRAAKLALLETQSEAYEPQVNPRLRDDELEAEHKRAVAEKDPYVINVAVIKSYNVVMRIGSEKGNAIYQALEDGEPVEEVIERFELPVGDGKDATLMEHPDIWVLARTSQVYNRKRNNETLKIGDSDGPRQLGIYGMYEKVIDKKIYPVLEVGKTYPGLNNKVDTVLRLRANNRRRIEFVTRIFEQADIRENGVPVVEFVMPLRSSTYNWPRCTDR